MYLNGNEDQPELVAPLVGAWIEIPNFTSPLSDTVSLPSWERGLKYRPHVLRAQCMSVAPLVGAWIEILKQDKICPAL